MIGNGVFITGTDTGVGKTYVASALATELRKANIAIGVMKPAETGCRMRAGKLYPKDAMKLMNASGVHDRLDLINPYRFRKPLAPGVAALLEGKNIEPATILNAFNILQRRHAYMIVEGAGGIMVPLSENYLFLDLAHAMKLPVLIVARPGLGTINHTLLTIHALSRKKVPIAGIVVNYAAQQERGLAEQTSPSIIQDISGVPVLGTIGHGSRDVSRIIERIMVDKQNRY